MDNILRKLSDGTVEVHENFDLQPFGTENDRKQFIMAMTEAESSGKATRLEAKIAAMPEGITRNKTFYPIGELEASLDSWTNPYPCPVIKDHDESEVDNIVGRISEAYIGPDGENQALWFNVGILDAEAQQKVADGTWAQVSIGTRVGTAKCSICENDWASGTWCDHERGNYYCKDPERPETLTECYWVMGNITGREVSFVVTPSAASAGVRSISQVEATEAEIAADRVIYSMALMKGDESDLTELRAVEYFGSPSSNGEATVPSKEKEEGVPPVDKALETEGVEELAEELEIESSDAPTNGEENVETPEDEVAVVDGPAAEEEEVLDESHSKDEEEVETPVETTETPEGEATPEGEDDSTPEVSDEAAETASAVEEPEEEADPVYTSEERATHLDRIAGLEAENLTLKAQVYVESGLRDGILAGEHDALVDEHAAMSESTLDELLNSVSKRRARVGTSETILTHKIESPIQRIDADKNADKDKDSITVRVQTKSGSHSVNIETDDTPVTVTPKF